MFGAIAAAVGSKLLSGYMDRQEARHSAKQQYTYNSWLQQQNIDFQREMAKNAHQYEIEDLEKAGLNPIISAQGSSASSIAGSSAPQGTSAGTANTNFGDTVDQMAKMMTATSGQELNQKLSEKAQQEALESAERTKNITPEAKSRIKNLNSATMVNKAEKALKESQTALNKKGLGSKIFGTDADTSDVLTTLGTLAGSAIGLGGIAGGAKGLKAAYTAYKRWKAGKSVANLSRL